MFNQQQIGKYFKCSKSGLSVMDEVKKIGILNPIGSVLETFFNWILHTKT